MRSFLILLVLFSLGAAASVVADTTIEWWQFWTDPDVKPTVQAIVNDFEAANPDIKVKLTDMTWANGHEKIAIAFASGSAPDVVELGSDWIAQFAVNGHLADLSVDMIADSGHSDGWSMASYDDKAYARPWILGTRVLFINQDLMKRAGLGENYLPITWDDLYDAAQKVNDLGRRIYGWGSNTAEKHRLYKKFLPFFWSAGGQIFSDDGKYCVLSSMAGIHALEFYRKLHDSCGYVADQRGIEDAFLDGRIGFIISGDWLLKRIELEKRDINFSTTLIPGRTAGTRRFPGRSFLGGEFLAINAASENKEAARKFITFVTSPENQLRFCKANRTATPSSKIAQQDEYFQSDPNLQVFVIQLMQSVHPPVDPQWVNIETIIERAVEKVLFEDAPIPSTLREARMQITELRKP